MSGNGIVVADESTSVVISRSEEINVNLNVPSRSDVNEVSGFSVPEENFDTFKKMSGEIADSEFGHEVSWQRSQSDANLSSFTEESGAVKFTHTGKVPILPGLDEENCQQQILISEQGKVYWNLHQAVEGEVELADATGPTHSMSSFDGGTITYTPEVVVSSDNAHDTRYINTVTGPAKSMEQLQISSECHTTFSDHSLRHSDIQSSLTRDYPLSADDADAPERSRSKQKNAMLPQMPESPLEQPLPNVNYRDPPCTNEEIEMVQSIFDKATRLQNIFYSLNAWLSDEWKVYAGPFADIENTLFQGCECLKYCIDMLAKAWSMPERGRDVATALCVAIREQGILIICAKLATFQSKGDCVIADVMKSVMEIRESFVLHAIHLLSQVLTDDNCNVLVEIISLTSDQPLLVDIVENAYCHRRISVWQHEFVLVLQGLFKHTRNTSELIAKHHGLHFITYACRSANVNSLRHVAFALCNLALYGTGPYCSQLISQLNIAHWLFPLAVQDDEIIRYYACLSIAILWTTSQARRARNLWHGENAIHCQLNGSSRQLPHTSNLLPADNINKQILFNSEESAGDVVGSSTYSGTGWSGNGTHMVLHLAQEVIQSGTLSMIWSFIRCNNPSEFAKRELQHIQGRSASWLRRLIPALNSDREEVQALASFHFCMEAHVKIAQQKLEVFHDIGVMPVLHSVASSAHYLAAQFAAETLAVLGQSTPLPISPDVPSWSEEDVNLWLSRVGYGCLSANFIQSHVDGDLLLRLNHSLMVDLGLANGVMRKRLGRELVRLKSNCSYASIDYSGLSHWLRINVGSDYVQYTYGLLTAGIDRDHLPVLLSLATQELIEDCGITNSVHRVKLLSIIRERCLLTMSESKPYSASSDDVVPSVVPPPPPPAMDVICRSAMSSVSTTDVFISYRRSSGCPLASLIKVHLQLRGYRVFLDAERLSAGPFPSRLLQAISQTRNFLLILTANSLDRCTQDDSGTDWVHREIAYALEKRINIIPIAYGFDWPEALALPHDMRCIMDYNCVQWVHEYQDACIQKIEKFLAKRSEDGTPCPMQHL